MLAVIRISATLVMLVWAGAAAADLYRWVDPGSGSVKFSSYPPPWYGDAAKERRAPKVELIPASVPVPVAKPAADAIPAVRGTVPRTPETRPERPDRER